MKKEIDIPCLGYNLKADWHEGNTQEEIILVLTGYSSAKSRYADFAKSLVSQTGFSALVLDYSGHGESPGDLPHIMPAQNLLDVVTTFDWLCTSYPNAKISVVSCSYGCYLSVLLAKYRNFHKHIMRAPAIYDESQLYRQWCEYDRQSDSGHPYRKDAGNFSSHSIFSAPRVFKGRSYMVQHELDTVCPKASTDSFAAAFHAEVWLAKGFEHSFSTSDVSDGMRVEYMEKVGEWLME